MRRLRYKTVSAAAASTALLIAGCSSGSGNGGRYGGGVGRYGGRPGTSSPASPVQSPATTESVSQPIGAAIAVTVIEQDLSIKLSRTNLAAGKYTFTVKNEGRFQHNLTIEGPGVDRQASQTVPGGSSSSLTVTLSKGSYQLWCSVDGRQDSQQDSGMELTITVS